MQTSAVDLLTHRLAPLVKQVVEHSLCSHIKSQEDVKVFLQQHVFAVWDFMCLLKALYQRLVTTESVWYPPIDALSANLIGDILCEEEGDIDEFGNFSSHFDIYIRAMKKLGADTSLIYRLMAILRQGGDVGSALAILPLRDGTRDFVKATFSFFDLQTHELAAAFVFGREAITSAMFAPMVARLETDGHTFGSADFSTLIYYFKRHIELDDNKHYPQALRMITNLIGGDERKLYEAEQAAVAALNARIDFLDDIECSLQRVGAPAKAMGVA